MSACAYIAETARNVSERIERDRAAGFEVEPQRLAEDVAWIARQLATLADSVGEQERMKAAG